MATRSKQVTADPNVVIADGEPLHLRNRYLAAVLAWLIPGAGHAYQRRYLKSTIFSLSVFMCFLAGMFMSQDKCVYASWEGTEKRWQYFLQVGVGLPALPAAYQSWRGNTEGFMAPPASSRELDDWHHETASGFEMGTVYTMVAGLLNLLVVFDAFAGPLPPPVNPRATSDSDEDSPDSTKRKSGKEKTD
ncbi:MAG TPA: hypothetical protein DDW52_20045 [Planctomycetaceae bacterium]|nr:hypothetical protein [Planctomycetaceae bacterium]